MWPQATDYHEAVQNPRACFADPELAGARPATGGLFGAPLSYSGNFAIVYRMDAPDGGPSWAVKCFTREVRGLHERYQAISEHLARNPRPFMVEFRYLDEGVRVRGEWFPAVKMRWVEGFTLDAFLREHVDRPQLLDEMALMWVKLARQLREAGMAHGDLQHGNVMLVPGGKADRLGLRLIDYDGMYVPALADRPSGERGHPNFQHPQRLARGGYGPEVDRFSHLLIYTALRCLRAGGADLWQRHDNRENLLFRKSDLDDPKNSALLAELLALDDRDCRALVGHLLLAGRLDPDAVPLLDDLLGPDGVRPWTPIEQAEVDALLGREKSPPPLPYDLIPPPVRRSGVGWPAVPPSSPAIPVAEEVLDAIPVEGTEEEKSPSPPVGERGWGEGGRGDRVGVAGHSPYVAVLGRVPFWVGVGGGFASVSLLFGLGLLLYLLLRADGPQPPPRRPPRLQPPVPFEGRGGRPLRAVVAVDRGDWAEELRLRVRDLPEGVRARDALLRAGETSATLSLKTGRVDRRREHRARVELWGGEERLDERPLVFTLRPPPALAGAPEEVVVVAGGSCEVAVRVERHGNTEPLSLEIDQLPEGVSQRSSVATAAGEDALRLTLSAAPGPQRGGFPWLLLKADGEEVDRKSVHLVVSSPRPSLRLIPRGGLTLRAGQRQQLAVRLVREGEPGDFTLRLDGLPGGVRCDPVAVAPGMDEAVLTVRAADEAPAGTWRVRLRGLRGEEVLAEAGVSLAVAAAVEGAATMDPTPRPAPPQDVQIVTGDGVSLAGRWYPGARGRDGACVLLLPDPGRTHEEPGWDGLAKALQKQGHAVLTFTFRGRGKSMRVGDAFWAQPGNQDLSARHKRAGAGKAPAEVRADRFPDDYLPWLVQDVVAARFFLDGKHAAGEVNTHNLVLVGAGQGATLGALWLAWECRRFQLTQFFPAQPRDVPEGRDVAGAVWLSLAPALGKRGVSAELKDWLRLAAKNGVAMALVAGDGDEKHLSAAKGLVKAVVAEGPAGKDSQVHEVAGTAAAGHGLLGEGLPARAWVVGHVGVLASRRDRPWDQRPGQVFGSAWAVPESAPQPASAAFASAPLPLQTNPLRVR